MKWRREEVLAVATRLVTCTCAAALLISVFGVAPVFASRNLGGHMYWIPRGDINSTTVEFHIFYVERLDASGLTQVGSGDPPDAVGQIYTDNSKTKSFAFGDGKFIASNEIRFKVLAIDLDENWVLGGILTPGDDNNTAILHQYPNTNARIAETVSACCLPQYDQLNAGRAWRLFSRVLPSGVFGPGSGGSPQSTLFPPGIVKLPIAPGIQTFPIPVNVPGPGIVRTFRKGDRISGETGSTFYKEPDGISIDPNTGLVSLDTSLRPNGSAWSFCAIIDDKNSSNNAFITSSTVYMEIVVCSSANSLTFGGTSTYSCGSTINANPNVPLIFTVQANDGRISPGGLATLTASGLPSGATVTPNPDATLTLNPTLDFSWTPTNGDIGSHVVTFTAVDECGESVNCTYTIRVNAPPDCSGVTASIPNPNFNDNTFQLVSFTGATDADGDPITYYVTAVDQDEPVGDDCPDAYIDNIPKDPPIASPQGNGFVRRQRDGAGAGGDGRIYHVAYIAKDGNGGSCSGVATVCVPRSGQCVDGGPLYSSTAPCSPNLRPSGLGLDKAPAKVDLRQVGTDASGVTLEYALPTASDVSLSVYDLAGRHLSTLVSEHRNAGVHRVQWSNGGLAKGIYYYRLRAGNVLISKSVYVR